MPSCGILNGAGQHHEFLMLETIFSEFLNHRRIIQYYPSSLHSYFEKNRILFVYGIIHCPCFD